jgi:DNA-binding transcriptional MerR regulator
MTRPEGWSAMSLSELTGIAYTSVHHWIGAGLVTPEKHGRGRVGHVIGVSGLLELLAVAELRRVGFSLAEIRRAVDNLRQLSGQERPLAHLTLVVSGNDIVWQTDEEIAALNISALRQPGQRLLFLPVGEQCADLLGRLMAIPVEARS